MAAQFGRAPLASLPALDFWTGAASVRPLIQAPHNLRLDGILHHSLVGPRVPYLYSVRPWPPFVMAKNTAVAAFLFDAAQGNLLKILDVENGGTAPGGTRRNAVNDSSSGDLWRYH